MSQVVFAPFSPSLFAARTPPNRRMREEAPVYYGARHGRDGSPTGKAHHIEL
jgi:hypothetical protein